MLSQIFRNIPPVTKNLLLINVLMYAGTILLRNTIDFYEHFALYNFYNEKFKPVQIITHMFMHGGIGHIFFNMFAMVMFGGTLERIWGPKKYLIYYFITGFGAMLLHSMVNYYTVYSLTQDMTFFDLSIDEIKQFQSAYFIPAVGASGAIFGLLIGFALLFPNTELMLIFLPVPIKAKYFIPILMVLELFLAVGNFEWDNIAHFAHLGGALAGFIMIQVWKRNRTNMY